MASPEQVLLLEPAHKLQFRGPFSDVVTSNLKLSNPTNRNVCFIVKTTAPSRYCVRPNNGIIQAGASVSVSVMLQPFDPDLQGTNDDKFMVRTVLAPPNFTDVEEVWKKAKPEEMMDSKLRCVFEMPAEDEKENDTESNEMASPCLLTSEPSGLPMKILSHPLDDREVRKIMEECKTLETEVRRLWLENRQMREDNSLWMRGNIVALPQQPSLGLRIEEGLRAHVTALTLFIFILGVLAGIVVTQLFVKR